ncbi:hypothetical protein NQD34_014789 [Periophthalmus magnuspinnatus]|nr:hypothetical protein NQD34_014789 [Periophthalmus magnuspinnatus]
MMSVVMMSIVSTVTMSRTEKNRDIGVEADGDTDSQDAESEDDEEQDAEEGQHDQGAVEDGHMVPDHTQARKNIWKDLTFLRECKLNVERRDPIDFFRHLFPADLIDDIVHNTNLYALQKGKENLAVIGEKMQIFLGINLIMGYIRPVHILLPPARRMLIDVIGRMGGY